MANLLDRFNKTVVGSNSTIADYTSKVVSSGDFRRIKDIEVIVNSWNNILTTPKRTYMFDPEYGSDLYKLVFEPTDDTTKQAIIDEVVYSIRRYDDRATIKKVTVLYLPNNKGFDITLEVEYDGDKTQLSVLINEDVYFKFFDTTPNDTGL